MGNTPDLTKWPLPVIQEIKHLDLDLDLDVKVASEFWTNSVD